MPLSKEDTQRAVSILESLLTQLDQDHDLCTLGLGQTHEPGQQVDGDSHGDDLDDLRRLQSAVDMMRSPLFSAIVDIRSRQANEQAEAGRNGTTATRGGTPEMRIDSRHNPEQVRERYGVPHDRSHTAVTSCNGGSLTNGAAHADNLEHTQPTAEYNGFSSFVLRSTFASGDHLRWDSDISLSDASGSDFKSIDKKSLAASSQASKSKKGSSKRSYDSSSSPLRRGGGGGVKDGKLKSEKKLSLGRRKGGGGKTKTSGTVTLADLAQSVPRASTSGKGATRMESPSIGNGNMGLGDRMMWMGSMELELCDKTPSSSSRKSFSQEEESSLSELSALIDSISVQSEPLLTDTGHHSSIAMTTTTVEEQATVIKNHDAISSESVGRDETTDTSKHSFAEEGVEQANIAMATVIENKDTCDSMPGTPINTKSASALKEGIGPLANERADLKLETDAESDAMCTATVIDNCDTGNEISSKPAISDSTERDHTEAGRTTIAATVVETSSPLPTISVESNYREERDGEKEKERGGERDCCDGGEIDRTTITGTKTELSSSLPTIRVEGIDGGIKEDEDKSHEQQLPRDILFFMRDKQSQTQLKQVLQGQHGRLPRTISLEVHDVPSVAGGGANIGIDVVGLSSTGVFVGGVSSGSSAEGKVQAGDQILEVNGRKIENMASFEVDMLLSEVPLGDKIQLTIQYNPSGLAEYRRLQQRRQ